MTDTLLVNELLHVARGELGKHEENGPNKGTCEKYQKVTGGVPGDSWCADFVCWCFYMVGILFRVPKATGSCQEMRLAARKQGVLFVACVPQPGDIGLVVRNADDHAHHMFIVEDYPDEDTQIFPTVEGNSNNDGSSNGDGTYDRHRGGQADPALVNNHYEFIRVFKLND